jgi:hypothetical protein
MDLWVVMVTDGTMVAFPPETYESRAVAVSEAGRWKETLSAQGGPPEESLNGPPWQVGDFTIRLVAASVYPFDTIDSPWVGAYWTADGYPDPEVELFPDRSAALAWVLDPPQGFEPAVETEESEWSVVCTYLDRGEETYAVAHRAKHVRTLHADPSPSPSAAHARYEVEIAISRLQRIEASILGPPELSREAIEDLVQENWAAIAANVTEDSVVSWELESFRRC